MTLDDLSSLLVHDFIEETVPLVESVAEVAMQLERDWAEGDRSVEPPRSLALDLHTIKGNAAMMGLTAIERVAHALEDIGRAAQWADRRDPATARLILSGCDLISTLAIGAKDGHLDETPALRFVERVAQWAGRDTGEQDLAVQAQPDDIHGLIDRGASSVRIAADRLDRLVELAGEATIAQTVVESTLQGLRIAREHEDLAQYVVTLGKQLRQLQSELMETRLLPVSTLFQRFRRYVRDLARERGADLQLVTRGADTPLDRAILDRLAEPLMHLVRNAVAHGIEPPADRYKAGKPTAGTITLAARLDSERVVISVEDDGRGLDYAAIAARGHRAGLTTPDAPPDELRRVIFTPGFSTAEGVSELAGRGVGLDVVASAVRSMGGNVDVLSSSSKGTVFAIDLPLTLAIVKSLLVEVAAEAYVLPIAHVLETLRLEAVAIHEINGVAVIPWRNELVPVLDAGDLLGLESTDRARAYCLVLAAGARRKGLIVDRIVGHQDVVVKALDPALGNPRFVSGGAILGDGRVVLILDVGRIADHRQQPSAEPWTSQPSKGTE